MRILSTLLVTLAACGGGAVCGGCSDDAGPVDTLPESFTLTAIPGTATDGCAPLVSNAFAMEVRNISTACTCYTDFAGRGDCTVSGDVISCFTPNTGPGGTTWTIDASSDQVAIAAAGLNGACSATVLATIGPLMSP